MENIKFRQAQTKTQEEKSTKIMSNLIIQVMILFSLISVGFICKKKKLISNNMNQDISSLLVNVTVPSMIIVSLNSITFSPKLLIESIQLLIISFFIYVFFVLASYLSVKLFRIDGTTRDIFQFSLVFGNTSFMGYPVAYAVFGEQGLFFMALCDVINPIFLWTFGVVVMSRPHRSPEVEQNSFSGVSMLKKIINPSIIAVCIGFFLLATSMELPLVANDVLHLLGGLTTPLAMIFIGSILGDLNIKIIFQDLKIILCSVERLVLLPLTVLIFLKIINCEGYLVQIPVLYASMPVAALTSILATKYGNDYQLASKLIFVSTILSIFTIPGIVLLVS